MTEDAPVELIPLAAWEIRREARLLRRLQESVVGVKKRLQGDQKASEMPDLLLRAGITLATVLGDLDCAIADLDEAAKP